MAYSPLLASPPQQRRFTGRPVTGGLTWAPKSRFDCRLPDADSDASDILPLVVPAYIVLIASPLFIGSVSKCPTADMIQPRVEALLADGQRNANDNAGDTFGVTREGQALTITRATTNGRVVEKRTLTLRDTSCAGAADDAALVIAAMLTEFRPEWIAMLPPAPPVEPYGRLGFRAAALAFAPAKGIGTDSLFWRLSADIDVGRARGTWLGAGGAFFEFGEHLDFEGGRAVVTRGGLTLGAGAQVRRGSWGLAVHGEGGASLTIVRGQGFSPNSTNYSADAVLLGGVEGARLWGPWAIAAGPLIEYWPRPQTVRVTNVSSSLDLPTTEVLLRVSLSFRPLTP
jgi:hypothetical protein